MKFREFERGELKEFSGRFRRGVVVFDRTSRTPLATGMVNTNYVISGAGKLSLIKH